MRGQGWEGRAGARSFAQGGSLEKSFGRVTQICWVTDSANPRPAPEPTEFTAVMGAEHRERLQRRGRGGHRGWDVSGDSVVGRWEQGASFAGKNKPRAGLGTNL